MSNPGKTNHNLFLLVMALLFALPNFAHAVDEYVWLHVDGKYIKKSPLCTEPNAIWMGCGLAHRPNGPESLEWQKNKVDWVASKKNINVVRISINNMDDFPDSQVYISSFLAPVINWYKEKRIYSIIDSHYYMHDSALWSGSFWDLSNPSTNYLRWRNDWVDVATYFKDEPWVAGYELCNEPIIQTGNGTVARCRDIYKDTISRIRAVDTKHIFFIGNARWSHLEYHKDCWETGLPSNEQYNPDPGYGQVVFTFHEYTKCAELYASVGGKVNDEIGRIQSTFNVPIMCTEFGQDETGAHGLCEWEKRRFEQEMIEMCYGQPNFWQGVNLTSGTDVSRGTPKGSKVGWILWRVSGSSANFNLSSRWTDIWEYAAEQQASSAPEPVIDTSSPTVISQVRDGTGADDADYTEQLSANWDVSIDTESGVRRFLYAVGTSAGAADVLDWTATSSGTVRTAIVTGVQLQANQKYYFSVKAQNWSGLVSVVTNSNGQYVINNDSPQIPVSINVYPNPVTSSSGKTAKFIIKENNITMVCIYTVSGKLVKKLTSAAAAGDPSMEWDGKNADGEKARRGIYIYKITTTAGAMATGKIALK